MFLFQGRGILLSDDDTCYEGEFTADMQMSGKVNVSVTRILMKVVYFMVIELDHS